MRAPGGRGGLAVVAVLLAASPSAGYYLDKGRNFDVRLRTYSQLAILTQDSEFDDPAQFSLGTLASHRNFYNPEFDAKLTPYTGWMRDVPGLSAVRPDQFKFHFAWWGFYDGLYDYLDDEWNDNRKLIRGRYSQSDDVKGESFQFNDENKNPRHIYASRNRINEMYLDWTKGRVFVRVGRQAISWGESDSVALLDVQNPFSLLLGVPAFFQDLEEARIPLWTARSTIKLVDSWRWLSSFFLDMYLVPGPIDTTTGIVPLIGGVSPYSAIQEDAQQPVNRGLRAQGFQPGANFVHTVTVQRLPEKRWGESRWGLRLTGIVANDYTVQGWFFRTYPTQPAPLLAPGVVLAEGFSPTLVDNRGFRTRVCRNDDGDQVAPPAGFGRTPAGRPCGYRFPAVAETYHRLESVWGLSTTWYNELLNGVIRTEAEFFLDEDAFIPSENLDPVVQQPEAIRPPGSKSRNSIPKANFLKGIIGFDKFFFFRPLNKSNSFLFSGTYNLSWNTTEDGDHDFRYPLTKPGKTQTVIGSDGVTRLAPDKDFEDLRKVEQFFIWVVETNYMHGKIAPRVTVITDVSGIFGFLPQVIYRHNDNLLFMLAYRGIAGTRRAGLGGFRDRDQVQLRLTFQLN